MNGFKGKRVGVLGFGLEGLSSAKFLAQSGAEVTVLDQRTEKELGREITEIASSQAPRNDDSLKFVLGEGYLHNLKDYDIIVRSPGFRRNLPEIKEAEGKGAVITSQTKIFFDLCPGKIIGVTGTKGKGTTSSLIYEMLKNNGFDAYLGGNIGQPPLDFLDKLNEHSWAVLELSSFQLLDLAKSPHIAVMLMVTSEHMDYHESLHEYIGAKRNILRFQNPSDFAVINRDYPASNESDIFTNGKIFFVSRERECEEGCFIRDNKVILNLSREIQNSKFKIQNLKTEIINTKDIILPGKHNWENVCAAVMAATLAGVSKQNIVSVLKTFKGLEHRLELVEEIDGVKFYDDSFSTTPETAIAAIEAFEQPEILILGGSSKNSDFTELGRVISEAKNIKAVIGIGEEWEKIKSRIQNSEFRIIEGCKSMRDVVVSSSVEAEPGDVVLLSPACASFGMFKNYKDRGEQFKKEVEGLSVHTSVPRPDEE